MRPARLIPPTQALTAELTTRRFNPVISNDPVLPVIDWASIGEAAPQLPATPVGQLPAADAVVITWAGAEWAAMEHVFCSSHEAMPYSNRSKSLWPGWQKYDVDVPTAPDPTWTYWGYYRLVLIGTKRVLLFKSNTHLDYPGPTFLAQLIDRIITSVTPGLILSIGTAGGSIPTDHVGTVNVVHAGTLYKTGEPPSGWSTWSNSWEAGWQLITKQGFDKLLVPVPTTEGDLSSIIGQFNSFYNTTYTAADLNIDNVNMGDVIPRLNNMTDAGTPLLTTDSFVVGTSDGSLSQFACVEMDDAIVAETCAAKSIHFGFIRNISDPVQNAALPEKIQAAWGSAIYDAYGFYTSSNGALAAWAILSA